MDNTEKQKNKQNLENTKKQVSDKDIKKILAEYSKAESIKNSWNIKYGEIAKYFMPGKNRNNIDSKEYKEVNTELFTSIGQSTATNFVNKMQSIITPIASDFISLEATDLFENKKELDEELNKICKIINNCKNASNFDAVISEFYYELIFGTACLLVQNHSMSQPLIFKVVPFLDYCITEQPDGNIKSVFRKIVVKHEEIKYLWIDSTYIDPKEENEDKEITLIEYTRYNYETKKYDYGVIVENEKRNIVYRTYKTNPFIILRWGKISGEVYGRGIGINAVNDIKTLNKIIEYSLRAFAFNIPTFLVEQDGIINPDNFELKPGALNFVRSTMSNQPSIMPLDVKTDHNISSYNIDKMTMEIKRNMYDSTIPDNPSNMSATEVNTRVAELNTNLTSMFGRIQHDFLIPLTKRLFENLQTYNYIDSSFDINNIDGIMMKIKINTPLSKQNKQQELESCLQSIQMLLQVDQTGETLRQYVKIDELVPHILNLAGMPPEFIKSEEEILKEQMEQAQIQQQQHQARINDEIYLSNSIEQGKANAKQQ